MLQTACLPRAYTAHNKQARSSAYTADCRDKGAFTLRTTSYVPAHPTSHHVVRSVNAPSTWVELSWVESTRVVGWSIVRNRRVRLSRACITPHLQEIPATFARSLCRQKLVSVPTFSLLRVQKPISLKPRERNESLLPSSSCCYWRFCSVVLPATDWRHDFNVVPR